MDYRRKIDFAIKLLRSIPQDGPIEICYSGGKDSDVILRLAQMANIPHEGIYKQTTIDPPGTTGHVLEMGVKIMKPRMSFLQIIDHKGMPTRRARFCCEVLKEYKVHDRAVQGIRRQESTARSKRYKEPEYCRLYPKGEKARIYLPILEWTLEDVERFILEEGVKCAPVYYDQEGHFHVERRLGCIGCPMKSDCGKSDFLKYPKLLKQIIKHLQFYIDTHPNSVCNRKFRSSAYDTIFQDLFCTSFEEYDILVTGGMFPETAIDSKKYLENYFKIDLTI